MSLYALPTIAEQVFTAYIAANYTGSYPVVKSFSSAALSFPNIMVMAGRFKEIDPGTGVYEGELVVSVQTQIDAADNPDDLIALHDTTIGFVNQYMANPAAVMASVNATGNNFTLWGYYIDSYDQARSDRVLQSIITYTINCQSLSLT